MEHKSLEQLEALSIGRRNRMTRRERLERWARLLEANPDARLRPLKDIEFVPPGQRRLLRAEQSPLTVAYEDPELRAEGLKGDTFGDAVDFFQLSDRRAHYLLCECHYLTMPSSSEVAARVRHAAAPLAALRSPGVVVTLAGATAAASAVLAAAVI